MSIIFGKKRRPIKQRLKETAYLFKYSFTIIGKDKDIKTPAIHMALFSAILPTILFASILSFFLPVTPLPGILGILVFLFLLIFKRFYVVRQKADLSWLVYNTLAGKDISYKDAHNHTKQSKGTLRIMAIVEVIVDYLTSSGGDEGGILNMIKQILLKALEEVWDLLSHFMIPAVAIENKHFKDIVPELKSLKNNVPATLSGVFGIDFAGDIVRTLLFPVYLIFLAISVGIGYLVAIFTESTIITIAGFSFSWVPVLAMLYIIILIGGAIKVIVEGIKTIYFTIFYTSILRPNEIQESMRDKITNYLLMKDTQNSEQKTEQTTKEESTQQTQPNPQENEQNPSTQAPTEQQQNTGYQQSTADQKTGQSTQQNTDNQQAQSNQQSTADPQKTEQQPNPQENEQNTPNQQQQSPEYQQFIAKLANYIHSHLQKGFTAEQITNFLDSKGYSHEDIHKAVDYMHKYMQ